MGELSDLEKSANALRFAAMNLLARREHSRKEVWDKLMRKIEPDKDQLDTVLNKLVDDDLLSDQRFSEAFVRWRVGKGQGPNRIRVELRERGVDADEVLRVCGVDWFALVKVVANKRFGGLPAQNLKEKAKRMRFLQYRGFSADHVRTVLK